MDEYPTSPTPSNEERQQKLHHARTYVRAMLLDGQSRDDAIRAIHKSDLADRDPADVVDEVQSELHRQHDQASASASASTAAPAPVSAVPLGLAAGLVGAVVGAGIWAEIVEQTHYQVGVVAIVIGFTVSWCALRATGGRTNRQLAIGVAVLTLLGFVLGKYLTLWLELRREVPGVSLLDPAISRYISDHFSDVFGLFDIVFAVIAVSVAWRAMQPAHVHDVRRQ